jgi:hypothetical protein
MLGISVTLMFDTGLSLMNEVISPISSLFKVIKITNLPEANFLT